MKSDVQCMRGISARKSLHQSTLVTAGDKYPVGIENSADGVRVIGLFHTVDGQMRGFRGAHF